MKTFSAQNKVIQNSKERNKDSTYETKMIKTTCPELHAINIKTHIPMSHPIRVLYPSVL